LRALFDSYENEAKHSVPVEKFKAHLENVFSPYRQSEQIVSKILKFVIQKEDQQTIELSSLNTLIDFALCYPF
jgi:hypothetical protein